ncbi:hypothetical protein H6A33_01560 [Collinsella tanakaei]|nr:hypothetical protein [Collinsella tanakaei]
MKRYIIACACIFAVAGILMYAYYYMGFYIDVVPVSHEEVDPFIKQEGKEIYIDKGDGFEKFEIRGVDMGVGMPGHFATDYAITKDMYLRWFKYIQEMGANTIRCYILQGQAFYEAFYEYNIDNPEPLYLIHGVWIDDYTQNSHMDAFDTEYLAEFKDDIRTMIDAVHGNRIVELGTLAGTGSYRWDISQWVIGYILGVEWEPTTVAYTDMKNPDRSSFEGEYMKTTDEASPFEAMLAEAGNEAFRYETQRYGVQKLVAFSNWATTDPFEYPYGVAEHFDKYTQVDVEHIELTDLVKTGTFASYHIYPYYPDYLRNMQEYWTATDPHGNVNTYYTYLCQLVKHHSIPVVISEFGVSTGRGMAQIDANTNRNQGFMSEDEQGRALVQSYRDIMEAGCAGSCIFTWQDEWFKRTWNTMANVDLLQTPYWSDYQTNEQYFGLISFDPGEDRSVSYVDGDDEEWTDEDVIGSQDGRTLSMKYDEKFLYFMVKGDDVNEDTKLYLPIDTTQKSGSTACEDPNVSFDRAADFLMVIDGKENSRVLVQERYEVMRATSLTATEGIDPYVDPPEKDSNKFVPIELVLMTLTDYSIIEMPNNATRSDREDNFFYVTYETGALIHGDANPAHENFNSLADYCFGNGFVEIKIPWQLLNFSDPSNMHIHDDYYENYGVDNMDIDSMYVGIGTGTSTIELFEKPLKAWGQHVTYHERLKESYFVMQQLWKNNVDPTKLLEDDSPEFQVAEQKARQAAIDSIQDDAA